MIEKLIWLFALGGFACASRATLPPGEGFATLKVEPDIGGSYDRAFHLRGKLVATGPRATFAIINIDGRSMAPGHLAA